MTLRQIRDAINALPDGQLDEQGYVGSFNPVFGEAGFGLIKSLVPRENFGTNIVTEVPDARLVFEIEQVD